MFLRVTKTAVFMALALIGLCVILGTRAVTFASVSLPKCLNESPVQMMKRSRAVFSGHAVDVIGSKGTQLVRFKVNRSWKGVRTTEVTLTNFIHHEGPFFQQGKNYLVFAFYRNGKLSTGGCSGTVDFESASLTVRELDRWKADRKQGRR
jgi:hypothetical protein